MKRQRSRQQHFFTRMSPETTAAMVAFCDAAQSKRYALAAHNAKRMPDRQTRADNIHQLTRDHAHPQMELALS